MRRKTTKQRQVCVEALEIRCLMTASTPVDVVGNQMPLYDTEVELAEPGRPTEPGQSDPSFHTGYVSTPVGGNRLGAPAAPFSVSAPLVASGSTSISPPSQALSQPGAMANFDRDMAFMELSSRNDEAFDRARLPGMPPDDAHGGPDFRFGPGAFSGAFGLGMPPGFSPRDGFRPNGPGDRNDWGGGLLSSGTYSSFPGTDFRLLHRLFEARELLADAALKPQPSSSAEADGSNNPLILPHGFVAIQQPPVSLNAHLREKAVASDTGGPPTHIPRTMPSPASVSHVAVQNAGRHTIAGISHHKPLTEPYEVEGDNLTGARPFAHWVDAADTDESSILPESMATLQQYLRVDWPGLESRLGDFIAQLEAFGTGAMSDQSQQPYASLTWVSLMVVVTVVLELARRQNQVPALDQDAYGMLNDRSSARRRTVPGESDFVS